jgi:hypothetical protein
MSLSYPSKRKALPALRWVVASGLFPITGWVLVAVKGSEMAYSFAIASTAGLLLGATRQWARSKGAPEWAADEAYITRLLRWRRSRYTGG